MFYSSQVLHPASITHHTTYTEPQIPVPKGIPPIKSRSNRRTPRSDLVLRNASQNKM